MESRLHHRLPQPQNQQNQINSGLIRYRSAPSSYFTTLMDRELCEEFFSRPSSLEPEPDFTPFPSSEINITESLQNLSAIQWTSPVSGAEAINNQQETNENNYISASPRFFHAPSKPPLPNQSINSGFEEDYSTGTDRFPSLRTGSGRMSNLIRHSSLPPGLLSEVNIQTGLSSIRGMASYGGANENNEVQSSFPAAGRSKNTSFDPMISIAELEDKPGVSNEDFSQGHLLGFENSSWDNIPADQSDNITGIKGFEEDDDDVKLYSNFSSPETQIVDAGNHPPRLAYQLSLPNTSAKMNAIENFLQFSDSVPSKTRAKRGCATHPRSIAERIRRTRISERMKKLQDLVPNMEKQTNTADMLDLAVEYIKDLQKQVQTLGDNRAKCSCPRDINNVT